MCVGFWSLDHPDYALILCTNRDEFLSRATAPAHFHDFGPVDDPDATAQHGSILSGRDLIAGGTWLGVGPNGRIALLTNITETYRTFPSSRGHLVSHFLNSSTDGLAQTFSDQLGSFTALAEPYAGFNLLLLSPTSSQEDGILSYDAAYVTNHGAEGNIVARRLSADELHCGGISNGIEGQHMAWPKVEVGMRALDDAIFLSANQPLEEDDMIRRLFNLLRWKSEEVPKDRLQLRNTIMIEPIVLAPKPGAVNKVPEYYERDIWQLDPSGHPILGDAASERRFQFLLEKNSITL